MNGRGRPDRTCKRGFLFLRLPLFRGHSVGLGGGGLRRDKMTLNRLRFGPEQQGQIGTNMANLGLPAVAAAGRVAQIIFCILIERVAVDFVCKSL